MDSRTSTDSITIRRPRTADCKGMKADDACSMVRRSPTSTDARGAAVRDEDVLPEGIGGDMVGGQGEGVENRELLVAAQERWVQGTVSRLDWAITKLCSPRTC